MFANPPLLDSSREPISWGKAAQPASLVPLGMKEIEVMTSKILALIAAGLALVSVSSASAAVKSRLERQYPNHNSVLLLEDRGQGAAINSYAEEHNYIEKQNVWK
jgi:hypothetical protein